MEKMNIEFREKGFVLHYGAYNISVIPYPASGNNTEEVEVAIIDNDGEFITSHFVCDCYQVAIMPLKELWNLVTSFNWL